MLLLEKLEAMWSPEVLTPSFLDNLKAYAILGPRSFQAKRSWIKKLFGISV